jgi:glycerophosphoryl diester phosphodiesterase
MLAPVGSDPSSAPRFARVVAHRGGALLNPENTLAAFAHALELGAEAVETDVHLCRSGELVCIHDETVDRTTDGAGAVGDLTLGELKRLDAGPRFYGPRPRPVSDRGMYAIPTLDELLELLRGRASVYIELKSPELYPGIEERLIRTLEAGGWLSGEAGGHAALLSFSAGSLRRVAELAPEAPRVQLTTWRARLTGRLLDRMRPYAHAVGPYWRTVTPRAVARAHDRGLGVFPYTVNTRAELDVVAGAGVDGFVTDDPREMLRAVGEPG